MLSLDDEFLIFCICDDINKILYIYNAIYS